MQIRLIDPGCRNNLDPKQSIESPAKPALRALYYTVEVLAPGD
jgi:hypothetical protein